LAHYDIEEANRRVCDGIRRLAARLGAPEKFHHTVSEALMRIVARRLERGGHDGFDAFLAANPDLLEDCLGVLAHYYSDERLNSPEARAGWVAPDRAPIL
jgi:N-formylglutamate deformylase